MHVYTPTDKIKHKKSTTLWEVLFCWRESKYQELQTVENEGGGVKCTAESGWPVSQSAVELMLRLRLRQEWDQWVGRCRKEGSPVQDEQPVQSCADQNRRERQERHGGRRAFGIA